MSDLHTERPNHRAGNCVKPRRTNTNPRQNNNQDRQPYAGSNRPQPYKKFDSSRKPQMHRDSHDTRRPQAPRPQRPKFDKVPEFMIPTITATSSNKMSLSEDGGAFEYNSARSLAIRGNSKVICASNGSRKRPIYVYTPIDFRPGKGRTKSMMFFAQKGDYVISESHKISKYEGDAAFISVFIFRVVKDEFTSKLKMELEERCCLKLPTQVAGLNTEINSRNSRVMKEIRDFLFEKKLECLIDAVCAAIDKSNQVQTTYSFYHSSKLASQFEKKCKINK